MSMSQKRTKFFLCSNFISNLQKAVVDVCYTCFSTFRTIFNKMLTIYLKFTDINPWMAKNGEFCMANFAVLLGHFRHSPTRTPSAIFGSTVFIFQPSFSRTLSDIQE